MKLFLNKILALLLAGATALSLTACGGAASSSAPSDTASSGSSSSTATATGGTLNIFTWDGYFPEDVLAEYQEKTGVKINYSNFESNEEMLTKLEATGAGDYDIVVASDYIIDIANRKGGILKELDKAKIANFSNIDPAYQSKFYDPENKYTIPYGPGTPLIVYNPETCKVDIKSFEDLWNPDLKDSIVAMDDARNLMGITLKSMGKSFNETDPAVIAQAGEKLNLLKPNIRTLAMNNLQDVLLSGEASVGYLFTAQVVLALQGNPNLKVVYPTEGMGFGIDCIFVPNNAPNTENAYSFINFILEPEIGARISSQINYLCANKASAEFLPEEYKSNDALYIPSEIIGETEFIVDVGEATADYDKAWTAFKQG